MAAWGTAGGRAAGKQRGREPTAGAACKPTHQQQVELSPAHTQRRPGSSSSGSPSTPQACAPGRQVGVDDRVLAEVQAQTHDAPIIQERLHLPAVLQQQAEQLQRLGQPAQYVRQLRLRGLVGGRLLDQAVAVAAAKMGGSRGSRGVSRGRWSSRSPRRASTGSSAGESQQLCPRHHSNAG